MRNWTLIAALFVCQAYADGEMAMGTHPCPMGMDLVQFSVGPRVVAAVCMSAAELEASSYRRGAQSGEVACRTLVVKAK